MVVTLAGMLMLPRLLHFSKAKLPMVSRLLSCGMLTPLKPVQLPKAPAEMVFTE